MEQNTSWMTHRTAAFFTKEVNPRLPKRPLKTNGRLGNRGLTSLVKEATSNQSIDRTTWVGDDIRQHALCYLDMYKSKYFQQTW